MVATRLALCGTGLRSRIAVTECKGATPKAAPKGTSVEPGEHASEIVPCPKIRVRPQRPFKPLFALARLVSPLTETRIVREQIQLLPVCLFECP
jgi:hypothetical protein